MNTPLTITDTITINAPAQKIWDVLTNPTITPIYMFNCEVVTDWKTGSPILWNAPYEGAIVTYVKGTVKTFEPYNTIVYTVIDPNGEIEDLPENYLLVTYTLSEENGQTQFTVTQGDYNAVAQGERRYKESVEGGGWSSILLKIKEIAEEEMAEV